MPRKADSLGAAPSRAIRDVWWLSDLVVGGDADPYLRRWWLIPRNRIFNVYLHHFMRSDDDRVLQ